MEAMVTNTPLKINANVINCGYITNLSYDVCVEVPCLVDATGIHPTYVGALPTQLAAMNSSNIYPQILTIEATVTHDREKIYHAAMMDPHIGVQLSTFVAHNTVTVSKSDKLDKALIVSTGANCLLQAVQVVLKGGNLGMFTRFYHQYCNLFCTHIITSTKIIVRWCCYHLAIVMIYVYFCLKCALI